MYTLQRTTNEYHSHVDDGEERFILNGDGVAAPNLGPTYERGFGYASTSWQTSMKSEWNRMYFIMSFSIVYLGNMGYSFEFMYSVCEKYKGTHIFLQSLFNREGLYKFAAGFCTKYYSEMCFQVFLDLSERSLVDTAKIFWILVVLPLYTVLYVDTTKMSWTLVVPLL